MNEVMNFAIVGSGMISTIHARCIDELPGARLVAICGTNRQQVESLAFTYGVQAYSDYQLMLLIQDIDIVCILTPSATHAELGIAAALAGKHVVVEKPIDISLDRADRLIEVCRASRVKLCCISQHRYDPAIIELKKAADTNMLGQLNFGASHTKWYRSQEYYNKASRGIKSIAGGGALINQSIHSVDLLQYIMGPVEELFSYCGTRAHDHIDVEDIAVAAIKFKSGAMGLIEGNTAAYPGFSTRLDIFGSDGSVIIQDDQVKEWKLKNGHIYEPVGLQNNEIRGAAEPDITHHAHKRQIEDFMSSISDNSEPLVNGVEARKTLQIILSIYESAETGKPIHIK